MDRHTCSPLMSRAIVGPTRLRELQAARQAASQAIHRQAVLRRRLPWGA